MLIFLKPKGYVFGPQIANLRMLVLMVPGNTKLNMIFITKNTTITAIFMSFKTILLSLVKM